MFYPGLGHNFKGGSLGIIGMDSVGEQVAILAKALGAVVSVCDRQIRMEGVSIKTIDSLLHESDMIVLRLADYTENIKFLGKERINRLKDEVVIVNTGSREWVDEKAMNEALKTGKVGTYTFEAETMGKSPLKGNDFALMFKPFSTFTEETKKKNIEMMVTNVEGIVRGMPYNKLEL
jgi:phosphoglycerate dehydrogenase-like enzyme